ncbi:hypothetical protein SLEP1_g17104 [Rubroshorea leprosula]|uniref:Uncharacterized protein n=1 Tax=Rubroshorea leprosula TaxID=152421 RepID=A0AAV5J2A6_9ROSI|nr:hypothetical protein SLEP1_g17104 [Rubroshorea leprosula]
MEATKVLGPKTKPIKIDDDAKQDGLLTGQATTTFFGHFVLQSRKGRRGGMGCRTEGKATTTWPTVKPKQNLLVTRFKDTDRFAVQNFLTPAESNAFIDVAESIVFAHQVSVQCMVNLIETKVEYL